MKQYNHSEIEKKWQQEWASARAFETPDTVAGKENSYILFEFPYPSGNLHVGHWYAFALTDIYARFERLRGKNVLFPVGFDAFGLPAENAAIKHGLNPRTWTYQNMDSMRAQMRAMGCTFDWSREVVTCAPEYYKWTQSLFLTLFNAGLVQKKTTTVNWDPVDKTVLANEQVLADGTAERSGALVEQKEMDQWTVSITKYADRLIDDLEPLDWPEAIKDSQRNWIGRSEGAKLTFTLSGSYGSLQVFTTRPDTLYGVTYLVVAPEHELVSVALPALANKDAVEAYITAAKRKTERDRLIGEKEKTGVLLDGVTATHPLTGESLPIYTADYVLKGYGTGAIMAVPAHDERDAAFAEAFGLPVKKVIAPRLVDDRNPHVEGKEVVTRNAVIAVVRNPENDTYLTLHWPAQQWHTFVIGGVEGEEDSVAAALREITEETGYTDVRFVRKLVGPTRSEFFAAHKDVNRIGYFDIHLFELGSLEQKVVAEEEVKKQTYEWVPRSALTTAMTHTEMPFILESLDTGKEFFWSGEGILVNSGEHTGLSSAEAKQRITEAAGGELVSTYKLRDWIVSRQRYWGCPIPIINCPHCGPVAVPEDQLPVVLPEIDDYMPRDDGRSPLAKATEWMQVSCPSCGGNAERETDTLDTFVDSSWYYLRYADAKNEQVFADREKLNAWMPVNFYSGGAEHTTMHLLYARFFNKALFDLGLVPSAEPFTKRLNRGLILGTDGNKMSKSKGNVIDPDTEVARFGADTVRSYLAFIGPYNEPGNYPWDPNGIVGVRRFLERAAAIPEHVVVETPAHVRQLVHQSIKKVAEDAARFKFNTAIAQLMVLTSAICKDGIGKDDAQLVAVILSPFAPHLAEELWQQLGGISLVAHEPWPQYDASLLEQATVIIAVQVNGKVRGQVEASKDATEADVLHAALGQESIQKWVGDTDPKKVIYVPGKLLSIVV
ncbi:MAG: leucyl-tRNA synthetase [Candidatus Parcubacteria bacterium]|jgi:leucyl-tRNA synthetase